MTLDYASRLGICRSVGRSVLRNPPTLFFLFLPFLFGHRTHGFTAARTFQGSIFSRQAEPPFCAGPAGPGGRGATITAWS